MTSGAPNSSNLNDGNELVDKWPNIHSDADWNRDEKEREIRENLTKMAGITIGLPAT